MRITKTILNDTKWNFNTHTHTHKIQKCQNLLMSELQVSKWGEGGLRVLLLPSFFFNEK